MKNVLPDKLPAVWPGARKANLAAFLRTHYRLHFGEGLLGWIWNNDRKLYHAIQYAKATKKLPGDIDIPSEQKVARNRTKRVLREWRATGSLDSSTDPVSNEWRPTDHFSATIFALLDRPAAEKSTRFYRYELSTYAKQLLSDIGRHQAAFHASPYAVGHELGDNIQHYIVHIRTDTPADVKATLSKRPGIRKVCSSYVPFLKMTP